MSNLKNMSIRLDPLTIEVLQEVAPRSLNMREFVEAAVSGYIVRRIGCAYAKSATTGITHAELCEMYLRHARWQGGDRNYTPVYVDGKKEVDGIPGKLAKLLHHRETGWEASDFDDGLTTEAVKAMREKKRRGESEGNGVIAPGTGAGDKVRKNYAAYKRDNPKKNGT